MTQTLAEAPGSDKTLQVLVNKDLRTPIFVGTALEGKEHDDCCTSFLIAISRSVGQKRSGLRSVIQQSRLDTPTFRPNRSLHGKRQGHPTWQLDTEGLRGADSPSGGRGELTHRRDGEGTRSMMAPTYRGERRSPPPRIGRWEGPYQTTW